MGREGSIQGEVFSILTNTKLSKETKRRDMKIFRGLIVIFSIFTLHLLCKSKGKYCAPMSCSYSQPSIEFPFHVKDLQSKSCGSPGFDVYCDSVTGETLLELSSAGNFSVGYIFYDSHEIRLSDPENCLAKKLISLDLTKISPFQPQVHSVNFSLYICSGTHHGYLEYDIIDCLSGSDYTVISARAYFTVGNSNCTLWKNVSAPVNSYSQLSSVLSIYLTWDAPRCEWCESSIPPSPPLPRTSYKDAKVPTIVVVVLAFPAVVILFVCCTCVICCTRRQPQRSQPAAYNNTVTTTAIAYGLDQNIIDLYPVIVIGESGRLITPDDATCPICLSDYAPHEMLKVLPECLHRFHADCIDEWLRAKAACPICRTSPPLTTAAS